MKPYGAQDIGSNETTKEKENNRKKGELGGKPGEQRAEDIPVHMPTMSHKNAISAMWMNFTQNSKEALLQHCLDHKKTDGRRSRRPGVQAWKTTDNGCWRSVRVLLHATLRNYDVP